jgi:hypothetical protein
MFVSKHENNHFIDFRSNTQFATCTRADSNSRGKLATRQRRHYYICGGNGFLSKGRVTF